MQTPDTNNSTRDLPQESADVIDDDAPTISDGSENRQVRGSLLLVGGRGLSLVLNLGVQFLVIRHLSRNAFGVLAYAISIVEVASVLSAFAMDKTLMRFGPIYHERRDRGKLLGAFLFAAAMNLGLGLLIALLVFVPLTFGVGLFGGNGASNAVLIILIVLAPINALESLLQALFMVFSDARRFVLRQHIIGPLLKLICIGSVILHGGSTTDIAWAYVAAAGVGAAISLALAIPLLKQVRLLPTGTPGGARAVVRELLGYSLPQFGSDIVFLARGVLLVFVLGAMGELSDVADYRAVLPLARLNELVMFNFCLLYVPLASRCLVRNNHASLQAAYRRGRMWAMVLTFPILAMTVVFAEPMILLLFGPEYADAGIVLSILGLGYFAHSSSGFNGQTLKVLGQIRLVFVSDVLAATLLFILCLMLIPTFGVIGGATAVAVTMTLHGLTKQWLLFQRTSIDPYERCYWTMYAIIGTALLALWQIDSRWSPPLVVAVPVVAAAFTVVLLASLKLLGPMTIFPQFARFRFVKRRLRQS